MSGKNMMLAIICVFVILCIDNNVTAQGIPSITSAPPSLSDGQSVTISGSSFGTTAPTIHKWDDFEGSTHIIGQTIGNGEGAIPWTYESAGEDRTEPQVSNMIPKVNSDKFIRCTYDYDTYGNKYLCIFYYKHGATLNPSYVTWYIRWDNFGTAETNNEKFWRIFHDDGSWSVPYFSMAKIGGDDAGINWICGHGSSSDQKWLISPSENQWIRMEFYGEESNNNVADGLIILTQQTSIGSIFNDLWNEYTQETRDNNEHWDSLFWGSYIALSSGVAYHHDFDDIYIADSRARIEIGDNSNFDSCTHREIQIPTVWSDGSISFTANQGSFQDGETAYLFVVDENGAVNEEGFEITIGQPPEGPTITSAPLSVAHGESVSISGSNFGSKSTAAPIKWDNFEDGTHGNDADAEGYWTLNAVGDDCKYDNADQRHANSSLNIKVILDSEVDPYAIFLKDNVGWTGYVYANFWVKITDRVGGSHLKLWRLNENGAVHAAEPRIYWEAWGTGTSIAHKYTAISHDGTIVLNNWLGSYTSEDIWFSFEVEYYGGTNGNSDAILNIYMSDANAPPGTIHSLLNTNFNMTGSDPIDSILMGYAVATGAEDATVYWDDIYLDSTWSRVEIGDNTDWNSCTHREIQIPTIWSDNSISFTANKGSFNDGEQAYLFVVDENGNVSNGFPITIGVSNCGNLQCDAGECDTCPGDCTLEECCGIEGCNPAVGEDCDTCPQDCGCASPEICCSGQCTVPVCSQDPDCGSDPCKIFTCNNNGTCSASCSSQDITSCINGDGCCPSGCTELNDSDCMTADCCDGLALLMHFNNQSEYGETATHIYDFSGNGNNGTVYGAIHSPTGGRFGGAFEFDGDGDYIEISHDPSLDITNKLTLAAWVYPTSITEWDYMISRASNTSGFPYIYYALGFNSNTEMLRMRVFTGSGYQTLSQVIAPDQWYHVVGTYSASDSNLSIYINGELAGSTDASGLISINEKGILIGGYEYGASESWNGYIDEVAVWDRTLSPQEIQDLYNSGVPITCQGFHGADTNEDGCVVMEELLAFIDRWKVSSQDVPMWEMMEAVGLWKDGIGCMQ